MIIDCHTRVWASTEQLGSGAEAWLARNGGQKNLAADTGEHIASARQVSRALVWGFRSRLLGADVPNAFLAEHVAQHPGEAIGIAAVDPTEPDCVERLENISNRSEFGGITLCPAAQGVHPADTRAMRVYEYCAVNAIPVFIENATDFGPSVVLEYARPALLDEVARTFPELTLCLSSLGWPWLEETVAILAKQPKVWAVVGAALRRPWEAYQALLTAYQGGVIRKLLFGSDFPFATAAMAIERLYRVNELAHGTSLPAVPREALRSIVERHALEKLGIRA